jgi:protein SCO1/2
MKRYNIGFIFFCLFYFACQTNQKHNTLPYYNTPDFTPNWYSKSNPKPANLHAIAAFTARDQDGSAVTEKDLNKHISLVNFFFTSCGNICPKMMHNLIKIQDSLQKNNAVRIFSFSVTPKKDSIAVLKNYEKENSIHGSFWKLLNGNKADIYKLARQSFFAEEENGFNADSSEFLHTEHILLIDKFRHIRGVYNGTSAQEMVHILEDLKKLENEDLP